MQNNQWPRLAASLLFLSLVRAAAAKEPTTAEAEAFMNKAEADLLELGNESQRAGWVQETYLNVDTDALAAKAGERNIARVTRVSS